jgi:phenylpyruvate tautomerase PptA (4-oxalocrotonate tautomerase family)
MPFVFVQTNQDTDDAVVRHVLAEVTESVHEIKKDPVEMISAVVTRASGVSFGGDSERPSASVQMTSTGFNPDICAQLTRAFFATLEKHFCVPSDRAYIFFREITPAERYMVGWSGKTFLELKPDPPGPR